MKKTYMKPEMLAVVLFQEDNLLLTVSGDLGGAEEGGGQISEIKELGNNGSTGKSIWDEEW